MSTEPWIWASVESERGGEGPFPSHSLEYVKPRNVLPRIKNQETETLLPVPQSHALTWNGY